MANDHTSERRAAGQQKQSVEQPAVDALRAQFQRIANDPRSENDPRHVAEHATAALLQFALTLSPPAQIVNALEQLIAALDAVDRGESHPLITPEKKKSGRRAQPIYERVTQGALESAIKYLRDAGAFTDADAHRKLCADLSKLGLEITTARISNLLEADERAARKQLWSAATRISNQDEYRKMLALLVQRLPAVLNRTGAARPK